MQGFKRKIVYATVYELIAILFTTLLLVFILSRDLSHSGAAAVISSAIALAWNLTYNTLFERWETKQLTKGRNFMRRLTHAIGFEIGLILTLVPFFAWWLQVSLFTALMLDLGVMLFFFIYTYLYNMTFDYIFGLPASAMPH